MRHSVMTATFGIALAAGSLCAVPMTPASADPGDFTTYVDDEGEIDAPAEITNGPGGDLYFTSPGNDRIGRIDPDTGDITTYASPQGHIDGPGDIAAGPTGRVWFTNLSGNLIGRLDPDTGVVNVYQDDQILAPRSITSDGAGGAWFTSNERIGHVTAGGSINSFAIGTFPFSPPRQIERAPDGFVWFLARPQLTNRDVVGRLDPGTGQIDFVGLPIGGLFASLVSVAPLRNGEAEVQGLRAAEGPTEPAQYSLWRIRPDGESLIAAADGSGPQRPLRLAAGPDLSAWATDAEADALVRISSPTARTTYEDLAGNVDAPAGLVTGPDGAIWFTSRANDRIGRIDADIASVGLSKSRDEASVVAGGTIHYHLTVTNTGTTPLTAISLSDTNAPGCAQAVPNLAPGAHHTVDCSLATSTSFRGPLTNVASVDTAETGPVNSNTVRTNVTAHPALTVTKAADDPGVVVGEDIQMTVTVTNTGDVPLVDVEVSDANGPDCAGPLDDIEVGASALVECSHPTSEDDVGTYVNTATVDTGETEPATSNTVLVQVGTHRDLAVALLADQAEVAPGDTVRYHAALTNVGDVPITGLSVVHSDAAQCDDPPPVLDPDDAVTIDCDLVVDGGDLGTLSSTVDVAADRLASVTSSPVEVTVAFPPSGLPDVAPTAPAADAVDWAAFHEIMGETASGEFRLRQLITRAQLATALFGLMDRPAGAPSIRPPDVARGAPYRPAMSWTVDQQLQRLRAGGTFDPRGGVTRVHLVKAIWRMVGAPTGYPGHRYTDIPAGASYAAALRWARATEVLDDLAPGDRFHP